MRFHHQTYAFILLFILSFVFQIPCFADQQTPNFQFDINDSDFSEDNAGKSLSEQINEFHSKVELEKVDSSADKNETPIIEQAQEPHIKFNLKGTNFPETKEEKPESEAFSWSDAKDILFWVAIVLFFIIFLWLVISPKANTDEVFTFFLIGGLIVILIIFFFGPPRYDDYPHVLPQQFQP